MIYLRIFSIGRTCTKGHAMFKNRGVKYLHLATFWCILCKKYKIAEEYGESWCCDGCKEFKDYSCQECVSVVPKIEGNKSKNDLFLLDINRLVKSIIYQLFEMRSRKHTAYFYSST